MNNNDEFMEVDLDSIMTKRRQLVSSNKPIFTFRQKLLIARSVAEAIHTLHEHGVVHRDINASNVLLKVTSEEPVNDDVHGGCSDDNNDRLC